MFFLSQSGRGGKVGCDFVQTSGKGGKRNKSDDLGRQARIEFVAPAWDASRFRASEEQSDVL